MSKLYLSVSYEDYKAVEAQLRRFEELETSHKEPGYYHKSFRLQIGDGLTLEIHGPIVAAGVSNERVEGGQP